jgi:hypothetical protein
MEIRNYNKGDEQHILDLFELVFRKPMLPDYWQWRFANNPTGKIMIKLMWDSEVLVGHYAVSPVFLLVDGEKTLTALSMTTMTHPDYAGKGIFSELAETLYTDEYKKNELAAIWGFPNTNSHYAFIKNLGWQDLEQIPSFSLDAQKLTDSAATGFNVADSFNANHYNAFLEVCSNYCIKADRSPEYLNWRYIQNPSNKYVIFEYPEAQKSYYTIAKIFPSFSTPDQYEIDLLEIMFPADVKMLNALLNSIKKHFSNYPLLKINCWLPVADKKHILLEKLGFINELPITYSGVRLMDARYKSITQAQNWFYCMGDSDIY